MRDGSTRALTLAVAGAWLLLYGALIVLAMRPASGVGLKYHWAVSALLVATGAYLAKTMPGRWFPLSLAAWLSALAVVSLLALWNSGVSDDLFLAGLQPYTDGLIYFTDAQAVLLGSPISAYSGRRPMFAAWFAGLLGIAGDDLRAALSASAMMVALALSVAAAALGRKVAAVAFVVVVWLFYRRFIGTVMTEHLGLALGLLAFACLWHGAARRSRAMVLLGLFFLTLGLNARPGAFFALPALALWASWWWARDEGFSWPTMAWGIAVIAGGFAANRMLAIALDSPEGAGAEIANFAYVLYGQLNGDNWYSAFRDHPELFKLDEIGRTREIYGFAMQQIAERPAALVSGAIRAWVGIVPAAFGFAGAGKYVLFVLSLAGLWAMIRDRRWAPVAMAGAALVGMWLSVPFAPAWAADKMRAYAATIPFLAWLPAWGIGRLCGDAPDEVRTTDANQAAARYGMPAWAWGAAAAVALTCFVLPFIARGSMPADSSGAAGPCSADQIPRRPYILPGTTVLLSERPADRDPVSILAGLANPMPAFRDVQAYARPYSPDRGTDAADGAARADPVVQFVRSLQPGASIALVLIDGPGAARVERIVMPYHRGGDREPTASPGASPACVDPQPTGARHYLMPR